MPKFTARFTRTEFKECVKEVEADTLEDAQEWADDEAIADGEWVVKSAAEDCYVTPSPPSAGGGT